MAGDERLLEYYERELSYLRSAGDAFARAYPKVARRLELSGDESPDPHVERLLEGFAFLAARIHQNIDDSTSDVANNLLEQLYPHALRPVPSATIACFTADPAKVSLAAGHTVARGTALFAHASEGESVYFRTCYPVALWPIGVAAIDVNEETSADNVVRSRLRLTLRYPKDFGAAGERPATLRFYVKGGSHSGAELFDLLLAHTAEVQWRAGALRARKLNAMPRLVGLTADQALLPERADTHAAYRLLLEQFAFPAKFHFFDIDCDGIDFAGTQGELLFVLERKPPANLHIENDAIQLGCTPVVNLFRRTAEPLRITGRQAQYKLVADHHRYRSTEIYSVERVMCPAAGQLGVDIPTYFSARAGANGSDLSGPRWFARRVNSMSAGAPGSDIELTLVDPDFDPAEVAAPRTLTAQVLCTNRQLARELDVNAELAIEDAGPIAAIRALHKPSAQVQPSLDGAARWKLVAQLSLNQWSLAEGSEALASLQQLLSLNNLTHELAAENQIRSITSMTCVRKVLFVGSGDDGWCGYRQGYRVSLTLSKQAARGSSQMAFLAVLHRFLALFAGINTFVELAVVDELGKDVRVLAALPAKHLCL
jgi:type VI secretion system protein ImpG